jgi:site-specific DNA-methyltransferase (adenine-specific)
MIDRITEQPFCQTRVSASPFFSFFNADCVEIMKTFSDNQFDLAIVDPPYSTGRGNGNFGRGGKNSKQPKVYRKDLHNYANHNVLPNEDYFKELFRVSKNQIIWGSNYYPEYLNGAGCIVWDKCKKDGIMSEGELAYCSADKKLRIFKHEWEGFRKGKESFYEGETKKIIHPNQKPIALYDYCIDKFAKNGYKILDTHLGSASSALSVLKFNSKSNMNLKFVGIELDTEYFNAAVNRFRMAHAQSCLSF